MDSSRTEANNNIPEGWKKIDPDICSTLEEEDLVWNWVEEKFWDLDKWRDVDDENVMAMSYISGMFAVRKIPIVEEKIPASEPVIKMNKSSFIKAIKNFK